MPDDDLEARLRQTFAAQAEHAPPPGPVEQRTLAGVRRGDAHSGRSRWLSVTSLRPVAVAASVLAVVGATAGGVALVRNLTDDDHTGTTHLTASSRSATATLPAPTATSATPTVSAPPPVTGSGSAPPTRTTMVEPKTGPVPAGLAVADLTFVGTQNGWALGTTSTCANRPCTSLVRTTDGGRTWVGLSPPVVALAAADDCTVLACVTNVRFASTKVGYLFGPKIMYLTNDGGVHWVPQAGGAVALEIAAGNVLRVTTAKVGCTTSCVYVVERSPIGAASWTTVLTAGPNAKIDGGAHLVRVGAKAFLQIDGDASGASGPSRLYASTDAGAKWTQRPDACRVTSGKPADAYATAMTTAPDGSLTVFCNSRQKDGKNYVATSTDDGATFHAGTPRNNTSDPVGASSRKVLFVQTTAGSSSRVTLLRSTDAGTTWVAVAHTGTSGYGGAFGGFVGFENATTGRWVSPADPRTVWTTTDAGAHWTPYTFK
jgi:hypothetical protein